MKIPDDVQGFGNTLRWLRGQERATIHRMSRALGVAASKWSAFEHDREEMPPDLMERTARFFGVDKSDLAERVGTVSKEDKEFFEKNPELLKLLREMELDRRCRCPHCMIVR